jgi:hypothetical protein
VQRYAFRSLLRPVVIVVATAMACAILLLSRLAIRGNPDIEGAHQHRVIDQTGRSADGQSTGVVT